MPEAAWRQLLFDWERTGRSREWLRSRLAACGLPKSQIELLIACCKEGQEMMDEGICRFHLRASNARLAELTGFSRGGVHKAKAALVALGLMRYRPGHYLVSGSRMLELKPLPDPVEDLLQNAAPGGDPPQVGPPHDHPQSGPTASGDVETPLSTPVNHTWPVQRAGGGVEETPSKTNEERGNLYLQRNSEQYGTPCCNSGAKPDEVHVGVVVNAALRARAAALNQYEAAAYSTGRQRDRLVEALRAEAPNLDEWFTLYAAGQILADVIQEQDLRACFEDMRQKDRAAQRGVTKPIRDRARYLRHLLRQLPGWREPVARERKP